MFDCTERNEKRGDNETVSDEEIEKGRLENENAIIEQSGNTPK